MGEYIAEEKRASANFFGDKNTNKTKFESAEGGKKKRKCAKKRQTFGLDPFPSHSSELGPIHTFL